MDLTSRQGDVAGLLDLQALAVPVRGEQGLAVEQAADLGVVDGAALVVALGHDVEQGLERRAGVLDAAVLEVTPGDPLLGLADVVHTVGEDLRVLGLGAQYGLGEDRLGVVEDLAEEVGDEALGDAVAEPAGQDLAPLVLEVLDGLQIAVGDQIAGLALLLGEARPDLRDQQRHVVVDLDVGPYVPGGTGEARVAGEDVGDQGVVEVRRRAQGIEGGLGQGPLGPGPGGGRGLAGQGADEVHEQLGQFLVVDRVVDRQRPDPGFRRIVAPAGEDRVHRGAHRRAQGQLAVEAGPDLGDVLAHRVRQVRADLEVARVLRRLAVHQPGVGGGDHGDAVPGRLLQALAHGGGELRQGQDILHHIRQGLPLERLVVGHEVAVLGHLQLRLLVEAGDDGVVRALEQAVFAVLGELDAVPGLQHPGGTAVHIARRDHHGGGDVVLHLHLLRGDEVLAQLEGPPLAFQVEADPQIRGDDAPVEDLELVPRGPVHLVHREVLAPGVAPLRAIQALDHEGQRKDARGHGVEPGVELRLAARRGGQELDHRAQAALRAQGLAPGVAVLVLEAREQAVGVVAVEDPLDGIQILVQVIDEDGPVEHGVVQGLGDLRLAAARDGAGLVAEGPLRVGPDQAPGRGARVLLHLHLVAVGLDIDLARLQADGLGLAVRAPR